MSKWPSRMRRRHRIEARNIVLAGCRMMLAHPQAVHYTQGPARWEGINRHLRVVKRQYPKHGDCSSTATWLLWNALTHAKRDMTIVDHVNGAHWAAGYTGTLAQHGRRVTGRLMVGDLVLYGRAPTYEHVAVYVGGGMVFSHGGEAGPFKLGMHYRGDLAQVRRYI